MLGFAGLGVALKALAGFPWEDTLATLINANYWILGIALVINLGSLVAKGWAWHLLLNPVSPNRWKTAQEANLVGSDGAEEIEEILRVESDLDWRTFVADRDALFAIAGIGHRRVNLHFARTDVDADGAGPLI